MVQPGGEVEVYVALEADGEAEVAAGGKDEGAATGCGDGVDGAVDGWGVDGLAVAGRAIGADVIGGFGGGLGGGFAEGYVTDRGGEGEGRELQEVTAIHSAGSIAV